jgi:hypothetical protein
MAPIVGATPSSRDTTPAWHTLGIDDALRAQAVNISIGLSAAEV